jgi:hypothetical protein
MTNLPIITTKTIKAWKSAGLRMYIKKYKDTYIVRVTGQ